MKDIERGENETIIIFSTGKSCTQVYVDGRLYGVGLRSVDFHKKAGESHRIDATVGILPLVGDGDTDSLKKFSRAIADEIQAEILLSEKKTAAISENSGSNDTKSV